MQGDSLLTHERGLDKLLPGLTVDTDMHIMAVLSKG